MYKNMCPPLSQSSQCPREGVTFVTMAVKFLKCQCCRHLFWCVSVLHLFRCAKKKKTCSSFSPASRELHSSCSGLEASWGPRPPPCPCEEGLGSCEALTWPRLPSVPQGCQPTNLPGPACRTLGRAPCNDRPGRQTSPGNVGNSQRTARPPIRRNTGHQIQVIHVLYVGLMAQPWSPPLRGQAVDSTGLTLATCDCGTAQRWPCRSSFSYWAPAVHKGLRCP